MSPSTLSRLGGVSQADDVGLVCIHAPHAARVAGC